MTAIGPLAVQGEDGKMVSTPVGQRLFLHSLRHDLIMRIKFKMRGRFPLHYLMKSANSHFPQPEGYAPLFDKSNTRTSKLFLKRVLQLCKVCDVSPTATCPDGFDQDDAGDLFIGEQ